VVGRSYIASDYEMNLLERRDLKRILLTNEDEKSLSSDIQSLGVEY
jgi:phosphate starvation-inducible protein PhoH